VTIEGSHQLLLGHSDTTMEVDVEGLFWCEMPRKTPLQVIGYPCDGFFYTKRRYFKYQILLLQISVLNTLTVWTVSLELCVRTAQRYARFFVFGYHSLIQWRHGCGSCVGRLESLGKCPREIVGIQGILQQLFDGINKLNSEAKKYARKQNIDGSMGSKRNQQMDELQTEVAKAQEETTEQVEELERKCCSKLTEHHEWLTNLERRNGSTVQEIQERLTTRRKPGRNGAKYARTNSEWHGRFLTHIFCHL